MLYVYENGDDTLTVHTFDSLVNTFYNGCVLPSDFLGEPSRGIYHIKDDGPTPNANPFKKVVRGRLLKQVGLFEQEYVVEDVTDEERAAIIQNQWIKVRNERQAIINSSDWIVAKHAESGTPVPDEWVTYRQALRDVTDQEDPFNITWPTLEV